MVGCNGHSHVLMRDGVVVWMENRHIPAVPALDTLLARARQYAEACWAAYAQLSWDGRGAAETFPHAFPWLED